MPPSGGLLAFRYLANGYHLVPETVGWALIRDTDTRQLATLGRARRGWMVVPPEGDGVWQGVTLGEALETFLDDNDEWERCTTVEQ